MDDSTLRTSVIERMGELLSDFGLNPVMGRVLGLLLCEEEPISLIRIAQNLGVSKALVSIQIRRLERLGYCRKLPTTKTRKHFYVLEPDYLEFSYRRRISKEIDQLSAFQKLRSQSSSAPGIIKDRLEEFLDFNYFIIAEQQKALEKWGGDKP
jgi:DNA-binding transcriptional regulator GbsR (MarR family)